LDYVAACCQAIPYSNPAQESVEAPCDGEQCARPRGERKMRPAPTPARLCTATDTLSDASADDVFREVHTARSVHLGFIASMMTPAAPLTLVVDFGASLIKYRVSDGAGDPVGDATVSQSPSPCSPGQLVDRVVEIAAGVAAFDRVSVGFPGMIRSGLVLSAPLFWSGHRGLDDPDPSLVWAWTRYPLQAELERALSRPICVVNDSALHAAGVIAGEGVEFVLTLGTGIGTTLAQDGIIAPHLELAHHPLLANGTYNDFIGDPALTRVGVEEWRRRVLQTIAIIDQLVFFDSLFLGGGNSRLIRHVSDPRVILIDPLQALDGGHRLWSLPDLAVGFYPSG
jgi:polyphosphate glucokinase